MIVRKRRHPLDRNQGRLNIYGEPRTDTVLEGLLAGKSDEEIENATQRLFPDQAGPWHGDLSSTRAKIRALYPELIETPLLQELQALLETHSIEAGAQHEILRWVAPRLGKRLSRVLQPPEKLRCTRCDYEIPFTREHWIFSNRGVNTGKVLQPCRWCKSKFWNRGRKLGC